MDIKLLLAAAAGAFAYHTYLRINRLEDAVVALAGEEPVVRLGTAVLDMPTESGDTEDAKFRFGFHN